jgi:FeS assembly SUF system protein
MELEAETLLDFAESQLEWPASAAPGIADEERVALKQTLTDGLIAALRTVYDPEIPVNIYDLGLIYRIDSTDEGFVEIDMTLTAPGCPVAGEMLNGVQRAVAAVNGVEKVKVNLIFDPPWEQSKMSEEAKLELGLM